MLANVEIRDREGLVVKMRDVRPGIRKISQSINRGQFALKKNPSLFRLATWEGPTDLPKSLRERHVTDLRKSQRE